MDNGLVLTVERFPKRKADKGLNPYCSGQWSRTSSSMPKKELSQRLNPYCSGQWSRTGLEKMLKQDVNEVLILIVVDNGLVLYIV